MPESLTELWCPSCGAKVRVDARELPALHKLTLHHREALARALCACYLEAMSPRVFDRLLAATLCSSRR